jgi:hypothetical protein
MSLKYSPCLNAIAVMKLNIIECYAKLFDVSNIYSYLNHL